MIEEIDKTYYQIENKILNHEIYQNIKDYSKAKEKIKTYLEVGKLLKNVDTKYGKNVIKDYSKRLTNKFGKKYTPSLLYKIKQFYNIIEKVPTLSGKLTWSHWYEMLSFDDINKIEYYVNQCEVYNLDVRQLRNKIKSNEYERIPADARNKLKSRDDIRIIDFVKNPIHIRNSNKKEIISEKILQKLILEDIPIFLKELGNGFTFIDNEYKIKLDDRYNYIDLLLYNIKYKCYVVVELKVTELKKEHTGQIMTYMNYIDKNIKTIEENDTVGIIICKQDNEYVIKYCSDDRIIAREYELVWYNIIGCDNIFKNVEELRNLIKLEKTKEKIIKSQIEYLNSDNSYGHPNKEVLSTLEYFEIYRTDIDGSIVVKIKNNKFKIETCSP
mgnify:CR=1 FL=1